MICTQNVSVKLIKLHARNEVFHFHVSAAAVPGTGIRAVSMPAGVALVAVTSEELALVCTRGVALAPRPVAATVCAFPSEEFINILSGAVAVALRPG